MTNQIVTEQEKKQAEFCKNCPICQRARDKQRGMAYWFVKKVESGFCPNCQSYEKVYSRPAHAPSV